MARPPFGDAGEAASGENGSGTSARLSAGRRNGLSCKIAGTQKHVIRIIGDRRGLSGRSMTRISVLGISASPYHLEPCTQRGDLQGKRTGEVGVDAKSSR